VVGKEVTSTVLTIKAKMLHQQFLPSLMVMLFLPKLNHAWVTLILIQVQWGDLDQLVYIMLDTN